ncbi:MAG: hypothetical protein ACUVRS_12665 [Armatimonadota bacterium]
MISFHELGALKAERSVSVSSSIEAKIIYLAPEGSIVKPGDKLVEFDTTELQRRVRERELALSNTEAEVRRVTAELEILKEENKTQIDKPRPRYSLKRRNETPRKNKEMPR